MYRRDLSGTTPGARGSARCPGRLDRAAGVAEERSMTKIVVIGAGVVGASAAYHLALAGADVTVLEATRVGGGNVGHQLLAWTNAHDKLPKPYHDLNVGGMKAHAALRDEFRRHAVVARWRQPGMGGGSRSRRATRQCRATARLGLRRRVDRHQTAAGNRARYRSGGHRRCAGRVFSGRRLARSGGLRAHHVVRRAAPAWREAGSSGRVWPI